MKDKQQNPAQPSVFCRQSPPTTVSPPRGIPPEKIAQKKIAMTRPRLPHRKIVPRAVLLAMVDVGGFHRRPPARAAPKESEITAKSGQRGGKLPAGHTERYQRGPRERVSPSRTRKPAPAACDTTRIRTSSDPRLVSESPRGPNASKLSSTRKRLANRSTEEI